MNVDLSLDPCIQPSRIRQSIASFGPQLDHGVRMKLGCSKINSTQNIHHSFKLSSSRTLNQHLCVASFRLGQHGITTLRPPRKSHPPPLLGVNATFPRPLSDGVDPLSS